MSLEELESYIKDEIEKNPFLEHDYEKEAVVQLEDAEYFTKHSVRTEPADPYFEFANVKREQTFSEYLIEQLSTEKLTPSLYEKCCYLVHSLNERGYLTESLTELFGNEKDLSEATKALETVQALDPIGTAARSLEECLLLQIRHRQVAGLCSDAEARDASIVVMSGLTMLAENDISGLTQMLGQDGVRMKKAIKLVRSLNPIPSRGAAGNEPVEYMIPDATIKKEKGAIIVHLNHTYPQIRFTDPYSTILARKKDEEIEQFLREKKEDARSLIHSIRKRESTTEALLRAIAEYQRDYFLSDKPIKPMTMNDLAEMLSVDVSTVSRTVQGKSVVWKGKTVPIRSLFSKAYTNKEGEKTSILIIRNRISSIIADEDKRKPLSDETIRKKLYAENIEISRRAITKHRELMGIPASSKRKSIDS